MIAIDPRVLRLLEPLLASRSAGLAASAIERVRTADEASDADGDERDPFGPPTDEAEDRRAERHLRIVDQVVGGTLSLELKLLDASVQLVREIGERGRRDGRVALEGVTLLPDGDGDGEASRPADGGRDMLGQDRRAAIVRTLDAWKKAVERTRTKLESGEG